MNNLKCGREVASSWIFNNSFMPQVTDIVAMYSVFPLSTFMAQFGAIQ
jgi:hypothetical protein